ncbi:MAG: 50S ribosomal protein L29 [Acidiferrobacteraceae bacterium]|jgi:large subunit ribosomal protein L29|nr:50S ribosomal protein L29 [Acidiferrobacteraceae bacterium]MBT3638821.1 50S ribosomal protein L29 [Acidiferrobacteraceae bacterium]MBT3770570.1 50S ribosomal protein L29 [Acidiferrobacteraceae bacterium]MBT3973159.1 50S ribosomal protein L29 [Acidiferrobacteraceae bacterium]MBT4394737.1 50S ribosomal protein L29 [Acidiferrobacteraceae bacterium]|tara:strand:+ start:42 stop:239 length:198 start_codon:yes stop_codon:yes gene_type:complete
MAEKKVTDMDSTELKGELLELRKEQFNLRMQRGTGQLTNSSRFKVVRRQIARIKTQMSEINRITS